MVQATIETLLRQKIGLDASSIGSQTIARAVEKRRLACGLPDHAAYLAVLQTSPPELEELIEAVVVPETWFFRDREPFVYLDQFAREWRKINPTTVLRVLSAPCSTGEEAYSIAITLLEAGFSATQFTIDAVDISDRALGKAKQGIYSKRSFRGKTPEKQRYFQEVATGVEVRSFVRQTVKFRQENLLQSHFLLTNKYPVIFCRNVLIYLDRAARNQLTQTLDQALLPLGLLFVGAVETTQITAKHYASVNHPFAFGYRKEDLVVSNVKPPPIDKTQLIKTDSEPSIKLQAAKLDRSTISDLEIAKQLADQGDLIQAARRCEFYLTIHPTDAQAYLLLGEIHQALNHSDRAEQAFQKAIYLNPNAYEALIHLALLKEQRGDRAGSEILRQRIQRLLNRQN